MLKNKDKIFKKKILIPASLSIFFIASILFFFTKGNILTIKNVEILGDNISCIEKQELKNYLNLKDKNILKINSEDEEKLIKKKFLCIKNISIDKIFPSSVELKISTRTPFGQLKLVKETSPSGELSLLEATSSSATILGLNSIAIETLIIDSDGFVFSKNQNLNIPEVKIVNQEIGLSQTVDHHIVDGFTILKSLQDQYIEIKEAKILEDHILVVTPPIIIFDLNKDKNKQLASLQLILIEAKINSKPIDRIDLRFDKPIVVYGKR